MKMITVLLHKNLIPLYNKEETHPDDIVEMEFPEYIITEWYKSKPERSTHKEQYEDLNTVESTDGLYEFSIAHAYTPSIKKEETESESLNE